MANKQPVQSLEDMHRLTIGATNPVPASERDKYPKYYEIDDVIVREDYASKSNIASARVVLTGAPYSLAKMTAEGKQISKDEAYRIFNLLYPNREMITEKETMDMKKYLQKLRNILISLWVPLLFLSAVLAIILDGIPTQIVFVYAALLVLILVLPRSEKH